MKDFPTRLMNTYLSGVKYILCMALLFCFSSIQAQSITGKVLSASGEGLIGATVVAEGTNTGTTTDMDGNFTLPVSEGMMLVISYTGFSTHPI